ncbi:MAG: hypothetical protein SNG27_08320 [Rikenellaceae bacterium]
MTKKEKRYGRPPKADPATHKYSLHLNSKDNAEFIRLFENSGIRHKSHFIASCIFDKQMKVIKVDKNTLEFYDKLKEIRQELRRIGVNYNQYITLLRSHFTEQRAAIMSEKSAKALMESLALNERAMDLTLQLVKKWLRK